VPVRRRKVEVDYYPSEGEEEADANENGDINSSGDGRKTATMYDLMVPGRTKIKAFTRQEEEHRQLMAQMARYGYSIDDINGKLPYEPLVMPDLDDLNFDTGDTDSPSEEDVREEFRRESLKD
jgi:hypothetical protein